jgi:uncharacterized protein
LNDPGRELVRTVGWRFLPSSGSERLQLWRDDEGWSLEGAVEAVLEEPLHVTYRVRCSPEWKTRSAMVTMADFGGERSIELIVEDGTWRLEGEQLPNLDGCVDVDIGVTPSTNTLPIRRLELPVEASAEIVAAWVRFPQLEVEPLTQRYTRLAERRYHYRSDSFQAELDVDDLGLVTTYQGVWERA